MTFTQINYFLAVADRLNFTQAAASLFVTQSTLSRSIAALENEIGVPLLERDFHSVQLTAAGELMYRESKRLMDGFNSLLRDVQSLGAADKDRFTLGLLDGQSVSPAILFAIRSLSDTYPNLRLDIRRLPHQELIRELQSGKLDAVQTIIAPDTVLTDTQDALLLQWLGNYLMARGDDPLWDSPVSLQTLSGRTLIAPEHFHPGLETVHRYLLAAGITPRIKKGSDMETQSLWLESGLGVYIGNESNVIYTSRTFRPLRAEPLEQLPKLAEVLLWSRDNPPEILKHFLSFLRTAVSDGSLLPAD